MRPEQQLAKPHQDQLTQAVSQGRVILTFGTGFLEMQYRFIFQIYFGRKMAFFDRPCT